MSKKRKIFLTVTAGALVWVAVLATLMATHSLMLRGWDWTVGSDNSYCYMYLPQASVGCEHAN